MDYLALAEKTYHVIYVGIVAEAQNIIVGSSRFLLGRKVLVKVCDDIALDGDS